MAEFKSWKYWRQAFYDLYQAFLRRSKAIRNIGGEFGVNVPVKTAPLSSAEIVFLLDACVQ